jgi:hypothetical protein
MCCVVVSESTRGGCSTLHCIFGDDVRVSEMSVVEYCRLPRTQSTVGSRCILKYCALPHLRVLACRARLNVSLFLFFSSLPSDLQADEATEVHIPGDLIMQTLPCQLPAADAATQPTKGWITSFFGINDDFKKTAATPAQAAASLQLRGVPLGTVAAQLGLADATTLWPPGEQHCSVWNARYAPSFPTHEARTKRCGRVIHDDRVFPVASTPEESLRLSLAVLASLVQPDRTRLVVGATETGQARLSWEEALKCKDMPALVLKRSRHLQAIVAARQQH